MGYHLPGNEVDSGILNPGPFLAGCIALFYFWNNFMWAGRSHQVGFGGGGRGRGQKSWRLRFLEAETREKWILPVAPWSWLHETPLRMLTFRTVRPPPASCSELLVGRSFATAATGSQCNHLKCGVRMFNCGLASGERNNPSVRLKWRDMF